MNHSALFTFGKQVNDFFFVSDGAYEHSMSICPPPLAMFIFSIVEIGMFLLDIVYLR